MRDPAQVKVDGVYVCAVCGERLPPLAEKQGDPFCATQCCKDFHGVEITQVKRGVPVGSSS